MSHYLVCSNLSVNKQINWIAFVFLSQILSVCFKYFSMTEHTECVFVLLCVCVFIYMMWEHGVPGRSCYVSLQGQSHSSAVMRLVKYEMPCRVIHTCCAHEDANQSQCLAFYWNRCCTVDQTKEDNQPAGGEKILKKDFPTKNFV